MRPKILLYNPRTVFHELPLALLAVGSAVDRSRYRVLVVDGRIDPDPEATLRRHLDQALCLGVTVLSGAPIRDALHVSRLARELRPDLPVVWGGWHPSILPRQVLEEAPVDAVIRGQGEEPFAALVDALAAGGRRALAELEDERIITAGAAQPQGGDDAWNGDPPPVRVTDLGKLPRPDYSLIDVEPYFHGKGLRQLDYLSSMGCCHRCDFCADPLLYGGRWTALDAETVAAELQELVIRYDLEDVSFQDEAFFTDPRRVTRICELLLSDGVGCSWAAAIRADQAARATEEEFATWVRAGLRSVVVGVEAGDQGSMDRLHKGISVDQVMACAERCRRHGVGGNFSFIVGLPDETEEGFRATLDLARRLRGLSPRFETPVFCYRPYPGSGLHRRLEEQGVRLPGTLDAWAAFDFITAPGPWMPPQRWRLAQRFSFYNRFAWERGRRGLAPLKLLARWRLRGGFYGLSLDKQLVELLSPPPALS